MKTFAAATAVAVALTAASAASAADLRVAYGDLDLATPAGAQQFDRRVTRASRTACRGGSRVQVARCVAALRSDIHALLPTIGQEAYARGRTLRQPIDL